MTLTLTPYEELIIRQRRADEAEAALLDAPFDARFARLTLAERVAVVEAVKAKWFAADKHPALGPEVAV